MTEHLAHALNVDPGFNAARCVGVTECVIAVSYTHLDVYKRQAPNRSMMPHLARPRPIAKVI